MSQPEVAAAVEVTRPAVGQWESGEKNPSLPNLLKLCEVLQLNILDVALTIESLRELRLIADHLLKQDSVNRKVVEKVGAEFSAVISQVSKPEHRRHSNKISAGRENLQKQLVGSFDPDEIDHEDHEPRMVEGTMGRDVGALPKDAILLADVSLGMGPGGVTHVTELMAPDGNSYGAEGIKDWVRLPADVVRGRFRVPAHRIRCFEAVGDSMEPKVHDGDIVFVDVGHRVPSPPGIYALADALGGVILKRLSISAARGQDPVLVDLISDNPKIPPERRTLDEITITGRYLGRLTTE